MSSQVADPKIKISSIISYLKFMVKTMTRTRTVSKIMTLVSIHEQDDVSVHKHGEIEYIPDYTRGHVQGV